MEGWKRVATAVNNQSYHYVSLGVGTGDKDVVILRELIQKNPEMYYFPVDMSPEMLRLGADRSRNTRVKRHNVLPIQIDFELDSNVEALREILDRLVGDEPILFSLLGNTLANFENDGELLKTLSPLIKPNDRFLLEVARTDYLGEDACWAAEREYSNSLSFKEFVTSALLQNTDLKIDVADVHCSGHIEDGKAIVIEVAHRNRTDTKITLPDRTPLDYPAGDTIRLYLSRKYTDKGIGELLASRGFSVLEEHHSIFPGNRFRFGINLMLLKLSQGSTAAANPPSVFISYSHEDEKFARRLHDDLKVEGVPCWYAPEDMRTGDRIRLKLEESIKAQGKVLVILSEHSLRSHWVEHEVNVALDVESEQKSHRILLPIRLDDAVMNAREGWPERIRRRNIADFRNWQTQEVYRRAFEKLLRDLRAE